MNMAVFSQQQFYFFYIVLLISIMSSLFLMMNNLVYAGRPTGFSLELIHSDFLESKNLSQLERMERAYQQTKALDHRQQQLTAAASSSMNSSSWVSNNTTVGGSKLSVETYNFDRYVVKIGLGSFDNGEPILYYLTFDTGSDLLWLQCIGADNPVPQKYPYFPWHQSSSFTPVLCDDHLLCPTGECYERYNRPCKYYVNYVDTTSTTGFLAKDTLSLSPGPLGKFNSFIFGCGMSQNGFFMGPKTVGIMGFAGGRESFVSQLGVSKFEYCLLPSTIVSTDQGPYTFIRFDSDTRIEAGGGQAVHTTPMYIGRGTNYYVTMIGISVGGTQIRYVNNEFRLNSDGTGGCLFDTGNPYSSLSTAVYVPLRAYLLQYYHALKSHPPPSRSLYDLCFECPEGFVDYPKIIFHFDGGADFEILTNAAFVLFGNVFCFNIIHRPGSSTSVTVGGIIQGSHRVLYDIGQQQLSWRLENCEENP